MMTNDENLAGWTDLNFVLWNYVPLVGLPNNVQTIKISKSFSYAREKDILTKRQNIFMEIR